MPTPPFPSPLSLCLLCVCFPSLLLSFPSRPHPGRPHLPHPRPRTSYRAGELLPWEIRQRYSDASVRTLIQGVWWRRAAGAQRWAAWRLRELIGWPRRAGTAMMENTLLSGALSSGLCSLAGQARNTCLLVQPFAGICSHGTKYMTSPAAFLAGQWPFWSASPPLQ